MIEIILRNKFIKATEEKRIKFDIAIADKFIDIFKKVISEFNASYVFSGVSDKGISIYEVTMKQ